MEIWGYKITRSKSGKRMYEAATKGRRTKSLQLARTSGVNREIGGGLVALRNASRHLVRNNTWANSAVEEVAGNTVGEGIQPALGGSDKRTKTVKGLWSDWAGSTACDWDEKTTFYGLQVLAMRSIAEGGDILIIKHWVEPDGDCPIPLRLQLLEGDQLDHTMNGPNEMGYVRLGVQFDKQKRKIGYWVFDHHPGDGVIFGSLSQSKFIHKSDVIHAYELLRPGQVRGLPIGVASFMKMSDFSDYEDAQLVKQKVAACYTAFVTGGDDQDSDGDGLERLEPGVIEHLSTGENVVFADPPSVADYDPYSSRILQGIATAYGITYEMLTKDYSRVNFTSGRMAQINVTKNFRKWQYQMMVPQVCQPVWKWFMNACIVAGLLPEVVKADWTAPRIQQLDPVKEVQAQTSAIQAGINTLSEVIRETGREPAELFEEYKQDVVTLKQMGISVTSVNPAPQKQP